MLKYEDLSPAQQKCVDAYLAETPELKEKDTITFKEIAKIHLAIHDKRDEGAPKVGFPNWMITPENKQERGVYWFPKPSAVSARGPRASSKKLEKKTAVATTKKAVRSSSRLEAVEAKLREISEMIEETKKRRGRSS